MVLFCSAMEKFVDQRQWTRSNGQRPIAPIAAVAAASVAVVVMDTHGHIHVTCQLSALLNYYTWWLVGIGSGHAAATAAAECCMLLALVFVSNVFLLASPSSWSVLMFATPSQNRLISYTPTYICT